MPDSLKPYISLVIIIGTLMLLVVSKMEVRRLGYSVFRLSRAERSVAEDVRSMKMKFARLTRPERIESYAYARLELKRAQHGQIIQLVAGRAALKH